MIRQDTFGRPGNKVHFVSKLVSFHFIFIFFVVVRTQCRGSLRMHAGLQVHEAQLETASPFMA